MTNGNDHLDGEVSALSSKGADLAGLEDALLVPVGLGVHDPHGLLGIVGLKG